MIKRRCLRFLFTGSQCTQSLESVDFFFYILRQLLVRLGVYDALKEFHRLCPMLRHLCEEMCEPCAGMPVLCTARKKLMGRCCCAEAVQNDMDSFVKLFLRHSSITCFMRSKRGR